MNIGTIGHVDHGKTSLTAAITKVLAEQPTRDLSDDWMNPPTTGSFTYNQPTGIELEIQRKRRIPTAGYGSVYEWGFWATFATEAEMWAAIDKLRGEHPNWVLRGRKRNHDLERIGIYETDDEMEHAYELFRRHGRTNIKTGVA